MARRDVVFRALLSILVPVLGCGSTRAPEPSAPPSQVIPKRYPTADFDITDSKCGWAKFPEGGTNDYFRDDETFFRYVRRVCKTLLPCETATYFGDSTQSGMRACPAVYVCTCSTELDTSVVDE